jgi:CheY-like chemotaxis protein
VNPVAGNSLDDGLRQSRATKSCILVVDENPSNIKLASYVLVFEGYHVLTAKDAEEALDIITRSQPKLILMDIALPGMDGLTLTRRLKADAKTRHIKVVAMTAFAMKGDEQKGREAGCDGYITKPIDTRTLGRVVAEFLAGDQSKNPPESEEFRSSRHQPS